MTNEPAKKRVFSGIQPSGNLHIGNYLGALKNWVAEQHKYHNVFCIVDLHALTVPQDPAELYQKTREVALLYLACGLSLEHCAIFVQSHIPAHSELTWLLNCVTPLGWLERMTQYKDKAARQESVGAGLIDYPVLMAADIILYDSHYVPVGEDQKQHLELTRDIAQKFNNDYSARIADLGAGVEMTVGEETVNGFFPLTEPLIEGPATRVMSLRDGAKKMSKSDPSDLSRINLTDDADTIARKIQKAKTDPEPLPSEPAGLSQRAEAENLVGIYAALAGQSVQQVLATYGGSQFSSFKKALAEIAVEKLSPIAGETERMMQDVSYIDGVLADGAARARAIAGPIMDEVKDIVGFIRS